MAELDKPMNGRRSSGFVLVDVIAALAIAGIALTLVIGGIARSARVADLLGTQVRNLVSTQNAQAGTTGRLVSFGK